MEVEEEREEKQIHRTERLMELTEGEMEGKDLLPIIEHPAHEHPLVLGESQLLQVESGDYVGGGTLFGHCSGCGKLIYSSASGARQGESRFYACSNSGCSFLLHTRCAELFPEIQHLSNLKHAFTLSDSLYPQLRRFAGSHIIKHPGHGHPLVLIESLQGRGGYGDGRHRVITCNGCKEPISSSSSSGAEGGGGTFYVCTNSDCWYLLHKRCAELPTEIEHPFHPQHALTLHFHLLDNHICDVCYSDMDGFRYKCFYCEFDVHVRCASMVLHIQDRVDENYKIHQHRLITIEMEAQFLCAACGREHKGKSYLCTTCGFWANQICASAPTTVVLRSHHHQLTLFRPYWYMYYENTCKICNKVLKTAYGAYHCSEECKYSVHIGCLPLEEIENPNKDLKEDLILVTWPPSDESVGVITKLIKNLNLRERLKEATESFHCRKYHLLIFVKKIDKSKDDQLCDACAQTISSQFYCCYRCNFYLHTWCAELPTHIRHASHPHHPLDLIQQHPYLKRQGTFPYTHCHCCTMPANGFFFGCFTCRFYLDLKCASLPGLIKHQAHGHNLALRKNKNSDPCNACGEAWSHFPPYYFLCEANCNFKLCIKCTFLPFSVSHRYDKHPFTLTYSSIKRQDEYYCEICEEDINTVYWFYHCTECDQSLHPECIYPFKRYMNMKFGAYLKDNFHSHLLRCVRRPEAYVETRCHLCGIGFRRSQYMAFECKQCNIFMHPSCVHDRVQSYTLDLEDYSTWPLNVSNKYWKTYVPRRIVGW